MKIRPLTFRWVLSRFLFSVFGFAIGLMSILGVEQIRNLFQLPWSIRLDNEVAWLAIGLLVFVITIPAAYIVSFLLLEPPRALREKSTGWVAALCRTVDWIVRKLEVVARLAEKPLAGCLSSDRSRFKSAVVLLVFAAVWFGGLLPWDHNMGYALERPIRASLSFLCLMIAAWLLLKGRMHPITWITVGRVLFCLVAWNIIGELIWAAGLVCPLLSPRNYTIWAVFHIWFCFLIFGKVVDVWQTYSERPVRFLALVAVIISLGLMRVESVGQANSDSAGESNWFEHLTARMDHVDSGGNGGPYVVVAASGGGSRAAVFTSLVLETLKREQVKWADRSAPIADNIVLISSVSGGSVASAYYSWTTNPEPIRTPKNYIREEVYAKSVQEISRILIQATKLRELSSDIMADAGIKSHDSEQTRNTKLTKYANRLVQQQQWIFTNPAVDDMATDFMAALLRGALHPVATRGGSVSEFWRRQFHWPQENLAARAQEMDESKPLLMFNVCEIGKGSLFVIGDPPLPKEMFKGTSARSLSSVDPGWTMSVADAVRLSANFPWGFQVGSVAANKSIRLTDGGVVDNTGLGTIRQLLNSLNEFPEGKPVLKRFRDRGIVLIEIDAGKKPSSPGLMGTLLPVVFEPLQGLGNASHRNAEDAQGDHLARIRKIVPPLYDPLDPSVPDITFQCNQKENVMTAWALGPTDKAKILARFVLRSKDIVETTKVVIVNHLARGLDDQIASLDSEAADELRGAIEEFQEESTSVIQTTQQNQEIFRKYDRGEEITKAPAPTIKFDALKKATDALDANLKRIPNVDTNIFMKRDVKPRASRAEKQ